MLDAADCQNCPYPDCIATSADINRQDAKAKRAMYAERNARILELWNSGMDYKGVAARMKVTEGTVQGVLRKLKGEGAKVRDRWEERWT